MDKILYFAYGSNLNVAQMKQRCPDCVEISAAVLDGWQLKERLYADIEPAPGKCVNGALYEISRKDLSSLDIYGGYPEFYTRKPVRVTDSEGIYREALVYIMTPQYQDRRFSRPFPQHYREVCSAGAEYWGIPNAFRQGSSLKAPYSPFRLPGSDFES